MFIQIFLNAKQYQAALKVENISGCEIKKIESGYDPGFPEETKPIEIFYKDAATLWFFGYLAGIEKL